MNPPAASAARLLVAALRASSGPLRALPWLAAVAGFFLFPGYEPLATQVFIMILFAMSLDLLVGYAGIVTLGHAALFGCGAYTAGILDLHGMTDPLANALCAMLAASAIGLLSGSLMLKTKGLAFLMLSLATTELLHEIANKAAFWTGGADGLQGMSFGPVLGEFALDFRGRTAYVYSLSALFLAYLFLRALINSPFGWSLRGIRENDARMRALGCSIFSRRLAAYVIASALAGLAGALQAQTTQFVALDSLSFELSGNVLIMLILGGSGRLYGALLGVPLFMFAQDSLAKQDPANWYLWLGVILLGLTLFAPGGILGIAERVWRALQRRGGP